MEDKLLLWATIPQDIVAHLFTPSKMFCDKCKDKRTEPKVQICKFSDSGLMDATDILSPVVIVMMPCDKQEFPEYFTMTKMAHNNESNFVMLTLMISTSLPETCLNFK